MRKVLFLFGQLNDDDVEWMLTAGTRRSVPAGGVLIQQGVPVDALFILLEGKLAVWLRSRQGAERELARLDAGEIVGEMSFVDARPPPRPSRPWRTRPSSPSRRRSSTASWPPTSASPPVSTGPWPSTSRRPSASATGTWRREERATDEEEDVDELDPNVLDGVYLAGERFDRMVKRVLSD